MHYVKHGHACGYTAAMKNDARRTITPPGSRITIVQAGFSVCLGPEIIAEVAWASVKDVFAYTRFLGSDIHLCLDFAPKARGKAQVVVNEKVQGWSDLLHALPTSLGNLTPGWERLASCDEPCRKANEPVSRVVPAHVVNPVHVWQAKDGHV